MVIALLIALLGLAMGSFAGVVVWRTHDKLPIMRGRSMCLACRHPLGVHDLVPVVSWLALGGRCRYCRKPIPKQDFLIELGTGILFGLSYLALRPHDLASGIMFGLWLAMLTALIILAVYDLRWMLLPNVVMYPALVLAAIMVLTEAAITRSGTVVLSHTLAGLAVGAAFYTLAALSDGKWLGGGDIKLAALMGLVLGPAKLVVALQLAFLSAAIISLVLLALHIKKRTDPIPFGPFLILGTITAMLYGDAIVHWYLHLGGLV
jgi:prepilin signal peptidase PulO-like enzyme (type II secretory pathway)